MLYNSLIKVREAIMEIPEKVIDEITDEIMKELEDAARLEGRSVTLDDIEGSLLLYRKKIGERMVQHAFDKQGTGKLEKKTPKSVKGNLHIKEQKKRK